MIRRNLPKQVVDKIVRVGHIFDSLGIYEPPLEATRIWVAGGYLRDLFAGTSPKDFDIFFSDEVIQAHTISWLMSSCKKTFENDNAVKFETPVGQVDCVKRLYTGPTECIQSFDFTVCSVASNGMDLWCHDTFFEDLASRSLVVNKITYPASSLARMQRYIQKGYKACHGTILEIVKSINPDAVSADIDMYPID